MTGRTVLVTGAGGYLGRLLARRLLERTAADLVLSSRHGDAPPVRARVVRHAADLARDDPFTGVDPARITDIVHAASVTRFNVDRALAEAVNVGGTERLLAFAERCPRLRSVTLLSSIYASGLHEGRLEEEPWSDAAGFANHYEWSKWAAEECLRRTHGRLPWRIVRIATVLAHDATGRVEQMNAIHNTLRLFYYGLISLLPGKPETPLYFVTGEEVADAILAIVERGADGAHYHVTPGAAAAPTLGAFVDQAFAAFEEHEDFRRRRVPRPVLSDLESFTLLAHGLRGLGSGILHQAVDSVAPFAPQLFRRKDFATARYAAIVRDRAPGARGDNAAEPERLIRATCGWLARTRWGRNAAGDAPGPESP